MAFRSEKDDDLFNNSSMSFGEHLIELRRCLLNAIYWLVGGFILALIPWGSYSPSFSSLLVDFVQHPLRTALEDFYVKKSEKKYEDYLKSIGFDGEISKIAKEYRMIPEEYWVFPDKSGSDGLIAKSENTAPSDSSDLNPKDNTKSPETKSQETTDSKESVSSGTGEVQNQLSDKSITENDNLVTSADKLKPSRVVLWKYFADDSRFRTKSLSAPETFVIFLKAAVFLGILLASPGIFYNFWSFVGAGLYPKEKKMVLRFLPLSVLLFLAGCSLAFFVIFKMVLEFLFEFNASMNIDPDLRISEWLNFAFLLPVAFGVGFQLPLVMFALERLRIFSVEVYWARWKVSIFVIAFLSMMFTPPDPWSMICLLAALIILYFGGIFLCWLFPRAKSAFEEEEEAEAKKEIIEANDYVPEEKA